ncbi:unnamed protein product [Agarophyton chilense]
MVANAPKTALVPNKGANTPTGITIPAPNRAITRRSAQNPNISIYAFVVRDRETNNVSNVSVSLKRNDRFMGLILKGHAADIVDLEFLSTTTQDQVHILASCDIDGVVYLWFLYVAIDSLGIDVGLRLLKKYSFYSLRRSKAAFYSRIRLAGTVENGTMILVPNDGSNCRLVTFNCHTYNPNAEEHLPAIEGPPQYKQILPPPSDATNRDQGEDTSLKGAARAGEAAQAHKLDGVRQGNTMSNANQFALERSADVQVVPQAPTALFPVEMHEHEELVPAEGKYATEALPIEQKSYPPAEPAATHSRVEESVSEEYVDAVSNVISESVEGKVLAEEDKVQNVPRAADVLDYGDLREIDGSEDEGRGDEFSDPEVEFGKLKGKVDEGYEAEGEFEAGEFHGRVDVAVGGFEHRQ